MANWTQQIINNVKGLKEKSSLLSNGNWTDRYKKPSGGWDVKKLQKVNNRKNELLDYVGKIKYPNAQLSQLTEEKRLESEAIARKQSLLDMQKEKEKFITKSLMTGETGLAARYLPYSELKREYPDEFNKAEKLYEKNMGLLISEARTNEIRKITGLKYIPPFILNKLPTRILAQAKQQYDEKHKGELPEGVAMERLILQERAVEEKYVSGLDILDKAIYKTGKISHAYIDPFAEGVANGVTGFTMDLKLKSEFEKALEPENFVQQSLRMIGGFTGAFLPYGLLSKGIKIGISALSGVKALRNTGVLYSGLKTLDNLAKTNKLWKSVLGEALVFNTLEEITETVIRKGVLKQDYTFNDFMFGITLGATLGSTIQIGAYKLALKNPKTQKQIEDVFNKYEEEGNFTTIMRMPLGNSTFGKVFGETRFAYLKGLDDLKRPGIEKAAPLPEVSPELKPLYEEAKKYKSAEEFVKAQGTNNPLLETAKDFENADDFISFYRGSSTQYGKYKPELRKFGTTEESIRVPELGVDPEKKITIYRGIDTVQAGKMRGTINDGDFVTTDFDAANAYTGGKVVSKEVKAKDLILDYPEKFDYENPFYKGAEFIYSDSKNKIIKRTEADLRKIFDEAKSYQIKIPLAEWEKQAAYIQKNGKIPDGADLKGYSKSPEYNKYGTTERQRASSYYEYVSNKIDEALKTKSQLTNIWNQANQKLPSTTLKTDRKIGIGGEKKLTPEELYKRDQKLERGFIKSVKEKKPELAARVAGQYVPRSTDELSIKAKNLIKDNLAKAEELAKQGDNDASIAVASELIKHYSELAGKAGKKEIANNYYDKAAEIANLTAYKLTEQGRAVQAASILGRLTPEGQLRFAAREIQRYNKAIEDSKGGVFGLKKKIPELTPEQTKRILEDAKRIQDMKDGPEKAIEFKKLQDNIADLVPTPLYRKLIALWKAGLLTGLKTSGLNIMSNLFHGISEIAKDIPSVAVDSLSKIFTGKRTLAFTLKGYKEGAIKEGVNKGFRYIKTGYDERNIGAKLDYKRVNFGKNKFAKTLQFYEEGIFRIIGAEDQPFFYGAKTRSLYSQAIAEAKNRGLKGQDRINFVENLVTNPTNDMLRIATNDAEVTVFQNRTLLGEAAKAIQRIPGGEIVVPFGRTPSAVAMQLVNYSPIGIVKTIVENIGKGRFNQREFSQGIGRGMTGTGVLFIGMSLFGAGMISLGYPESDRERKQWELEGRKPNSIKIGGKWRSLNTLGPLGSVITVGGYIQQGINKTGSLTEGMVQATAGAGKTLTDQTFLIGIDRFTQAIKEPTKYAGSYLKWQVASIIPTIVSDIAKAADDIERRSENFFDPLLSRIPGARTLLPPRINIFGRPVEVAGNALETLLDPTRPSKIQSSNLIEELKRLADNDYISTPTEFAEERKYNILTDDQKTRLLERAGTILEGKLNNFIVTEDYKNLSDEEKSKIIQEFVDKSRILARAELVNELVSTLEGEEKRNKLSELKKNGILTSQVFDKYIELFE